jgi:phospholipid/cholesterol/gamma-HCH transport system substrate-binding protein
VKRRTGMSNLRAGTIALVVIVIALFLGFTKDIPFTKPFEVNAVFRSANSIRPGAQVRVAGVNVGKVKSVTEQEGSNASVVRMQITTRGLPLHADATAKIRPRIFLEGNFFVDLKPGTPSAPALDRGDTIKVTQTSTPVQLDQVLTALQNDTREDLKTVLDELAVGLRKGAPALNDAYDDIADAERSTAIVNEAFLGTEPTRDVQRLLRGLADTTEGLNRNEVQLKELVSNFNTTMGAFAAEQSSLQASIRQLGPTLEAANGAFDRLNAAFPNMRAFAREILPGVRQTPATIDAGFPWVEQMRLLMRKSELRGLVTNLSPATRDLAGLVNNSTKLFPQAERLSKCATNTILPAGDIVIHDAFDTNQPNYREFMYALVGLAGESQNFDGNGQYVRFQPGGGSTMLSFGEAGTAGGLAYANGFPGGGVQPVKPKTPPPYNDDTQCSKSPLPDLNGPWAAVSEQPGANP